MLDKYKNTLFATLFFSVVFFTANVEAAMLDFNQSNSIVTQGDTFEVELTISNLGDDALGGFDVDITYDPEIISYNSFIFGDPVKGNQLDLFGFGYGAFQFSSESAVGVIDITDLSLDFADDLLVGQENNFVLGVFSFNAVGSGFTELDFTQAILSDAYGYSLSAIANNGSVHVNSNQSTSVPEPSTLGLFALFFLALRLKTKKLTDSCSNKGIIY